MKSHDGEACILSQDEKENFIEVVKSLRYPQDTREWPPRVSFRALATLSFQGSLVDRDDLLVRLQAEEDRVEQERYLEMATEMDRLTGKDD